MPFMKVSLVEVFNDLCSFPKCQAIWNAVRLSCWDHAKNQPDIGQSAVHMLQLISSPELVLTYPHIQARDKCNVRWQFETGQCFSEAVELFV